MAQLADFAVAFDDRQPLFILRKSSLVGLWLATFLYGVYVILFGISVYIFWTAGKARNLLLQLSAVFMFSLSTAHMILDIITTLGMDLETGRYIQSTAIAAVYLHLTNSAIADSVIIYRCYIVWGFNKYFILPIILVITTTGKVSSSLVTEPANYLQCTGIPWASAWGQYLFLLPQTSLLQGSQPDDSGGAGGKPLPSLVRIIWINMLGLHQSCSSPVQSIRCRYWYS
ncbi:hypothetical protein PTI98_001837 [Pleurotus ostreatus]|nr:hypothetical protein PTI98_001837 [Pleurotus ostreatus]